MSGGRSPSRGRSLSRILLAFVGLLVGLGAACSESESAEVVTTVPPSLDDLPVGASAFEFEVLSLGAADRHVVLQPAPVGQVQDLTVEIATDDTSVRATLRVKVLNARADGSSETISITATGLSASDPLMAEALSSRVGASVNVERGPNRVVRTYSAWELHPSDSVTTSGPETEQVDYWLTQLLSSVVAFVGPIPDGVLGEGARWSTVLQSTDGSRIQQLGSLDHLDAERYVIAVQNTESPEPLIKFSSVLEGTVGQVLPSRQGITVSFLDGESGSWSTTGTTITAS